MVSHLCKDSHEHLLDYCAHAHLQSQQGQKLAMNYKAGYVCTGPQNVGNPAKCLGT